MAGCRLRRSPMPAMADPETERELALISYREVLDATKHQDDKIGRLLAAVAFLTGGALVFTARDILQASYVLVGHEYRLTALLLGAFLVLDLVAVVLWILTMATPLTLPGTSASDPSFLFFRVIAKGSKDEWREKWKSEDLAEGYTDDLIAEAHNLARRADGKYDRSNLATRIFLASVILLVPTLVLSIDSVSRLGPAPGIAAVEERAPPASTSTIRPQPGEATLPTPWTAWRRTLVALPIALVVLALGLWRRWISVPKKPVGGRARPGKRLSLDLWALGCAQSLFVFALIVGYGAFTAWAVLVLAAGAIATGILFDIARKTEGERPMGLWLTVAFAGLFTLFGTLAIAFRRPDFQFLVALGGACLVPFESTPSIQSGPADVVAPTGSRTAA
jgi:hypothetical protein